MRAAHDARPEPARMSAALNGAVAALDLPASEAGNGSADRVADLIVMGHTLEERDGADSVMFNALCIEISQALNAGIEAADPTIVEHWGDNCSRTFITRMVRTLASNGVFQYRNVNVRDESTNRSRRRRVFVLNRSHPLTGIALSARLGPGYAVSASEFTATNDAIATPPLDGHHSAEADSGESADDAEAAVLFT